MSDKLLHFDLLNQSGSNKNNSKSFILLVNFVPFIFQKWLVQV